MKRFIIFLLVFVFSIQLAYAKAVEIKWPSPDVTSYSNMQDQGGLKVAVKFISDEEAKEIFGTNKFKGWHLAVFVTIENTSPYTYEFKKSLMNDLAIPAKRVHKNCIGTEIKNKKIAPYETNYGMLYLKRNQRSEELHIRFLNVHTGALKDFSFSE